MDAVTEEVRNAIAVLSRCAFIKAKDVEPWDRFVIRWALGVLQPFGARTYNLRNKESRC